MTASPPKEQATETANDGYEETTVIPSGRKARTVTDTLWEKLEASAARNVGFVRSLTPKEADEFKRDLTCAAVRVKYDVTIGTEKVSDKLHKVTFSARHKTQTD